ncbi:MAG: hypothetical protein ABSD89_07520 [Halobacteriota archaeon]|jgi:hypothetical protein
MAQEFSSGIGMSPRPLIKAASVRERVNVPIDNCGSQLDIPALNALALRSLVSLFEEKEKLFSRRVTLTEDGFYREGPSRKRTIIALLGLQRLAESGGAAPVDVASIRDGILEDTSWVRSVGDLGLQTWLTAECAPERLEILLNELDFGKALNTFSDGRQACTKGLALFLAGIAHARLACPGTLPDLTDVAVDTYHLLQDNQSEGRIFGHAAFPRFLQHAFCSRFGTFADQIYAIYALTTFARAFQIEEPLGSALGCANSLRALQGEMGQWWYLYDKSACRVVNRYPVFSLHQDGIAPVSLLALGEATGQSFHEPVYKGLSWIAGANELGDDLRNQDRGLIWDSIAPRRRIANYWEATLNFMNISHGPRVESLRIRYEARPDHFGWLLYAFGRFGLPKVGIAAVPDKAQ